jgi:hypothetical protein
MKAWLVKKRDEPYATVVFAETRGKAKVIAMNTDACEDADFLDIDVTRYKHMDKYYVDGKTEMDWYNAKDRIALVKDAGFHCVSESIHDVFECDACPAKKYCDKCEEIIEDRDDFVQRLRDMQEATP